MKNLLYFKLLKGHHSGTPGDILLVIELDRDMTTHIFSKFDNDWTKTVQTLQGRRPSAC